MSKTQYTVRNEEYSFGLPTELSVAKETAMTQAREMQQRVYIYEVKLVGVVDMVPKFTPEVDMWTAESLLKGCISETPKR